MGKILMVNASPRAPRSNSKRYAGLFAQYWKGEAADYCEVTPGKREEICTRAGEYPDLLLVFPLYADGIPVTLLEWLKVLEKQELKQKPVVHVLINCGFLEAQQNLVAVDMVRLFCKENGFPYGATLCVGSGEAILNTPFVILVKRKLKRMAKCIRAGKYEKELVTMPLSTKTFLKASEKYWLAYGEKNRIGRAEMETMKIEGE